MEGLILRVLRRFGSLDAVVTTLTVITAVQMGLIVVGNLTDFETNHQFVIHVLAMDTTFQTTMWRAITSPALATSVYIAIIAWELASAVLLFAAAVLWVRPRGEHGRDTARQLSTAGWLMWVILFGGGFIAIGGEWFSMWQSETWNGLQPALQNLLIAGLGLILAHLRPYRETIVIQPDMASEGAEQ
jgi:predicted small integral membrane protein